jgi:hypothetical protein
MVCAAVPWCGRPGASVARLPYGLLAGDVVEQVAQGEGVLVAVVAIRRSGIGSGQTVQMVVVHDGPGAAGPGEASDLEPGGPAALFAARGIQAGVGDPRRGDRLRQPLIAGDRELGGLGSREQVGVQVASAAEGCRIDAGTCWPALAVCPDCRLTPWPGLPNSESAGGCEGYDEKAIAPLRTDICTGAPKPQAALRGGFPSASVRK